MLNDYSGKRDKQAKDFAAYLNFMALCDKMYFYPIPILFKSYPYIQNLSRGLGINIQNKRNEYSN